ncbi:MAG: flagellar basal body P-ring protein FlgI [Planctomycetes bacterium]|nr:flagellar basal body P-ring protein FlgI [Planctomycetota bacterium]
MNRSPVTSLLLTLAAATPAWGQIPTARVGDITHLQGQGTNVLIGYGLVTGLDKTGDGAKFLPTMKALAATMERFGAKVDSIEEIDAAKNIAVVMVEVVIPDHGAREGELLDVSVTAMAAKSLTGGRLLATPLIYHDRSVEGLFGFAQGAVQVSETVKTAGTIRGGARLERDVLMHVVATGTDLRTSGFNSSWIQPDQTYVTLVLDDTHAGWSMAAAIAQALDKELGVSADVDRVALAMDAKNVVVLLPAHQRGDPASWIRDVERTPLLMESNEARVTINRNTGTIVVTGDTRLSPVVISQLGLTVTVSTGEGEALTRAGVEQQQFVPVDVAAARLPNVKDLLEALNRLKVPFKDRAAILESIHRAGKLHARLVYEG